jgi:hypothetical protein
MRLGEIIGKTITDIYSIVEMEHGGLDKGECFIELDGKTVIDIPFALSGEFSTEEEVPVKELKKGARSLFGDLSDISWYHINKEGKTIAEIAEKHQGRQGNILNRIAKALFGFETLPKEYRPYKVEYHENKLKYIKDRKIDDFIWFPDEIEKGFLLLDNGYLITETSVAPHGTGQAGLNLFESISGLTESRGNNFLSLSNLPFADGGNTKD